MSNRLEAVVADLVEGVRGELEKHNATFDEYRQGHVHFEVQAGGFHTLITQPYFEGGDYVDSDCCEGVHPTLIHADRREGSIRVIESDFELAPALAARAAGQASMCHGAACTAFPPPGDYVATSAEPFNGWRSV